MIRLRATVFLLLFAFSLMALAATTQPSSPQDLLKSKGLIRIGNTYLLDGDAHLADTLRPMRKAKHDMESAEKSRSDIQDEIRSDEDQLEGWIVQRDSTGADLKRTSKKSARYNELVVQMNELTDRIERGKTQIERRQDDFRAIKVPQRDYFDALTKFLESFKSTSDAYEKLAADAEVSTAIETLYAESKFPYRLGPSQAFQSEMPEFRKLLAESQAGIVKVNVEGNVARVTVTINDAVDVEMVVDSGASIVTLSPAVADRLGIRLSKSDRIVRSRIANGQIVESHLVTVKSIRLGQFTVENVLCDVQPTAARDSDCLLGGTFLQNFAYQMDLTNGELHLSQISGRPGEEKPIVASAAPPSPSTPRPASSPSAPSATPVPSTAPLGRPVTVGVKAATGWAPSDIQLQEGKCYQITAPGQWTNAKGKHCTADGICPPQWSSPLGPMMMSKSQIAEYYVDQSPRSCLIARVDRLKPGFLVGQSAKFIAPASGTLEFAMNDGNEESTARSGQLNVTVVEIKPQWLDAQGNTKIEARIDNNDFLHITPGGVYWEWGGHNGKVGERNGHYPTIINGIFWWPKWVSKTTTAPQIMPGLDPAAKIRITRVLGETGDVQITQASKSDTTLHFIKGRGRADIGCEVQFSKP